MSRRQVVLLLGAPGAGKGTQARFLSRVLGLPHVASGDLLREHRRLGSPLGRAAQQYMDRGDLVPDRLVVDMVLERIDQPDAARGVLLDGFPRTRAQAEVLDASLAERQEAVSAALYLDVDPQALVERLAGRWVCRVCQSMYHERFAPPAVPGVCTACGGELEQRPDDRREVVENRVEVYLRDTLPVIQHYGAAGRLRAVDGGRPIEEVRVALCAALGGVVRGHRRDRWHLFVGPPPNGQPQAGRAVRTLCGKWEEPSADDGAGTPDAFLAHPCRECRHALHARQLGSLERE